MGRRNGLESLGSVEPEGDEFISSLAASMGLQLIVEVSPEPSQSMVCILLEQAAAKLVIQELGLEDRMEYKVGNPYQLLPEYKNIDFSFIDCKADRYPDLLRLLDINLWRAVVAANRLEGGKEGLRRGEMVRCLSQRKGCAVGSLKRSIGSTGSNSSGERRSTSIDCPCHFD